MRWRSGKIKPCCYFCDINLLCILQLLQVVNCSDCSTLSGSLSRNGDYFCKNQDRTSNFETKLGRYRNRWGNDLFRRKLVRKMSFQTMVFARKWFGQKTVKISSFENSRFYTFNVDFGLLQLFPPVKPYTPKNSEMLIVLRPIRCEMKPQR